MVNHPRLELKNAMQLLDLLGKIYLKNIVQAPLIFDPIIKLIERF